MCSRMQRSGIRGCGDEPDNLFRALTRVFLGAGGARQARYLSCLAKKGNPKKATRRSRPSLSGKTAKLWGSLCFLRKGESQF